MTTETPKPKRKSKGPSPTARAMAYYRGLGFAVEKVEQRLPHTFITRDLFNVVDLIAIKAGIGIVGVQVTSGSNHAARRTKACDEPLLREWMLSGGRFEILSFAKRGARGERKLWTEKRDPLTLDDLTSDVNGGQS